MGGNFILYLTIQALSDKAKKEWSEVEKLADPSKNMKNYRDKLLVSVSPMVPFLRIIFKCYSSDIFKGPDIHK